MTDAEYQNLIKRVADGKKFLEDKWGSTDPQIRAWIDIWTDLDFELVDEHNKRGYYKRVPTQEEMKKMQEETLKKAREQILASRQLQYKKGGQ